MKTLFYRTVESYWFHWIQRRLGRPFAPYCDRCRRMELKRGRGSRLSRLRETVKNLLTASPW